MLTQALFALRDGLLSLSYPQECMVCGRSVESLRDGIACSHCWNNPGITALLIGRPVCSKCGNTRSGLVLPISKTPLDYVGNSRTAHETGCGDCSTFPFAFARACGLYTGTLEASILFLKSYPHVCRRLQDILFETYLEARSALEADLVIPVPLHRTRARERGFNQAAVIARYLCRRFKLVLDDGSLVRDKATRTHRAGMDASDRARSVKGAFRVTRKRLIEASSVLLVDDVFTTGSTVSEACRAILEAGASRVSVLTLGRVAWSKELHGDAELLDPGC